MPINDTYSEDQVVQAIAQGLENFYTALLSKMDTLNIEEIIRKKNPYLFRAKSINSASDIVSSVLSAFVSSSEETIFGNEFFEPIATIACQGRKALAEGVDIMVETTDSIYAIAVKSGPSVFNSSSKKRQEENFNAASRLASQVRRRFVPIIGYSYGKKRSKGRGRARMYHEFAGQDFWYELTGDSTFYIKLINYMQAIPEQYVQRFEHSYSMAENRLVRAFTEKFCRDDGSIDWECLVEFNSGYETDNPNSLL